VTDSLMDLVLEHDELADLDPAARRLALRALVARAQVDDVRGAVAALADAIDGYGPLSGVMRDDAVSDVLINGPFDVWVERAGRLEPAGVSFDSERQLAALIDLLVGRAGSRVDASCPIADARLSDGSRFHVVLPPVAPGGPLVSIRRHRPMRFGMADLVASGMLAQGVAEDLVSRVRARATIAISGGTGSGKTTLMNALLSTISRAERIVVVEETPELAPRCPHAVFLVATPANIEGHGGLDLDALVRAALRMRPDRIIVGEVRGPEMVAALAAMSTGHDGSMVTVHANSASDAIGRMASLALQGTIRSTESSVLAEIRRALDLVIHLERRGGRRCVAEVVEVT
jgi:pilus assembly protein CpaF